VLEELDDGGAPVGCGAARLVRVDGRCRRHGRPTDGEGPFAVRDLVLEPGDLRDEVGGWLPVVVGHQPAQASQLAGQRRELGVGGRRDRVDPVRDRPPPLDTGEDAVRVTLGDRALDVEHGQTSAVQGQGGPNVQAGGLELVRGEQAVAGGDPSLGLDGLAAGRSQPGSHERVVQSRRQGLAVGAAKGVQSGLRSVEVAEQQARLGLEPYRCAVRGRGRAARAGCRDASGHRADDGRQVVAGGDVDGGPHELGLAHELDRLAGAVGRRRLADVAASAVEVAGEQVAPGQPQADLSLLEPVALAAGCGEGLGESCPGAVDEPGLEQHLGLVQPGPVPRDRGVHGVGLAHQDQRSRQVTVDERQAGEVVAGLELLVGQAVLGRGLSRTE
jgi:hypothetical protein